MPADDVGLTVSVLGDLEISLDGRRIDRSIPLKSALIVVYLADSNGSVRRSRLAGLFWSDHTEAAARSNLRVALTRLRSAVGDRLGSDREQVWLTGDVDFDVAHVEHAADPSVVLERYQGDLLDGIEAPDASLFNEWLESRRQSVRATAMLSLNEHVAAAHRDRNWAQGAELARRVIELEPWNEAAHRLGIEAAAATEGRAAALAKYERCVDELGSSLGLEPDAETVALVERIRSATDDRPTERAPRQLQKSRLPFALTPFHGRDDEVEAIQSRLTDGSYRLLTIVGPGGVGKTRLGLEVARRLETTAGREIVWAPLASISNAPEMASLLTDLLVEDSVFNPAEPLAQITAALGDRSACLVLDNFEHLDRAAADLLLDVLQSCPDVAALVTSRQPIGSAAEDVYSLAGLPTPPVDVDGTDVGGYASVRMFVDRAYRADKSFSLDDGNAAAVASLCRRLDGVPLHMELAASRLPTMSVFELNDHLEHELELPGSPPADAPDRHKTFDAVFQQSWDLLDDGEREALTRLSVTRGGFDRAAAEVLIDGDSAAPSRLARKSLLVQERSQRFRFHELVRQSAAARLDADDRRVAEIRHAEWYLQSVAAAGSSLRSASARSVASALLADLDNVRRAWAAAIEHDLVESLAAAAEGLAYLFELAGRAIETEELMAAVAAACASGELPPNDAADEAFFLRVQARQRAAWSMDDTTGELCERINALLAHRPDRTLDLAWSQLHHAQARYHLGDLPGAEALLDESEQTAAAIDDLDLAAWSLLQRGRLTSARSNFDEATDLFTSAIELFESVGDLRAIGQTHSYLAVTYAERSRIWDAFVADRTALEICEQTGNRQRLSACNENLAASLLLLGDFETARARTATALSMYRQNAEFDMESYALAQHGECLLGLGDVEGGERDMAQGIAMMRSEEFTFGLLYNLPPWARHLQRTGRHQQATLVAEELIVIANERGAPHFLVTGEALLARSMAAVGDLDAAVALASANWDRVESDADIRLPWPEASLLDLAVVFRAADDERAARTLDAAREQHRRTTRSIDDPELRRCFLDAHPVSRELAALAS